MPTSILEHSDLMYVVILALIAIIVWLLKGWHKNLYETIKTITQALTKTQEDLTQVRQDVSEIQGVLQIGRRSTDVKALNLPR